MILSPNTHQRADVTSAANTLGLELEVADRLRELSGQPPSIFFQREGSRETWHRATDLAEVLASQPMFVSSTWSVVAPDHAELNESNPPRWHLSSVIWLDIDNKADLLDAIADARETRSRLESLGIDPQTCSLFGTGSKGFHIGIPLAALLPGGAAGAGALTAAHFPLISREFVLTNLATDSTDLSIYSRYRGRIWRQPGVLRPNGRYKVPLSWAELANLRPRDYKELCSAPRDFIPPAAAAAPSPRAAATWAEAMKKVCRPAPPKPKTRTSDTTPDGRLRPDVRSKIERSLAALDVNAMPYSDWIRVGAALKSTQAADALAIWIEWSRSYRGFRPHDCESRWGGLTGDCALGTIHWLAQQATRTARAEREATAIREVRNRADIARIEALRA